jgi:hypothetical protein
MADRNSIIEKIKALLAKTTANGATEAEMLSALGACVLDCTICIGTRGLRMTKHP